MIHLMIRNMVLALLLFFFSAGTAYNLACHFFAANRTPARLCAAGVIWHWLLLASFNLLAFLGLFKLLPALLFFGFLATVSTVQIQSWSDACKQGKQDLAALFSRVHQAFQSREAPLYWACLATLAVTLSRGVLIPSLCWDSLTYHHFFAGSWVQKGGFFSLQAPDFWGSFYQYFPINGEVISAWFMLPFHGDSMVSFAHYPAWAICLLAFYALARHLEIRPRTAAQGTLLLGFSPVLFSYLNSGYVEIFLLGHLLAGTLFLLLAVQSNHRPSFLCSAAAFGGAMGCKLIAGPPAALALFLLLAASTRKGNSFFSAAALLGGILFLFLWVGLPPYAKGIMEHGSPSYPYELRVAGISIFKGAPFLVEDKQEMPLIYSVKNCPREMVSLRKLFWPPSYALGQTAFIAIFISLFGFYRLFLRGYQLLAVFSGLTIFFSLGGFFSKQMIPNLVYTIVSSSRYLGFPFSLVLLAAFFGVHESSPHLRKKLELLFWFSLGIDLFFALPFNWDTGFWGLNSTLIGVTGFVVALCGFLPSSFSFEAWAFWQRPSSLVLIAILLITGVSSLLTMKHRDHPLFFNRAFEVHNFPRSDVRAWQICDTPDKPLNIAVAAGWDRMGHNWWFYPLLGRNLQNTVSYIPISKSGEIINYWNPSQVASEADFSAWMARLHEQHIDTLVLFPPGTQELKWVKAHPEMFVPRDRGKFPRVFSVSQTSPTPR